ncbi:MAG: hypothetical protein IKI57_02310 [Clostridia bacterium]|nr:hypothetical protein [Clostridia bacterium]
MKRYISYILLSMLLVLFPINSTLSDAYTQWYGTATVISTTVSVREQPDTRSTRLYKCNNMDELYITGEYYDWYVVDCYQSGLSAEPQTGYVLKSFCVLNGYRIQIASGSLNVYTDPWSGHTNGQKVSAGETLFVIYETNEWLVCQLNTEKRIPGTCFVKKVDVGMYDYNGAVQFGENFRFEGGNGYITSPGTYGTRWMVMYDHDGVSVGIREQPDLETKKLAIIHSGDIVTVIQNDGEFAYVLYVKENGQQVYGWVRTKYFVPAE